MKSTATILKVVKTIPAVEPRNNTAPKKIKTFPPR
jgi:hypothetical protein